MRGIPQRKARLFRVTDLAALRTAKGLSMKELAERFTPPVSGSFIGQLEVGRAKASTQSLFDLARVFRVIEIEDELGCRYRLAFTGRLPVPEVDKQEG